MRLRPSGKKGPLAVQLSSFIEYQGREAETWEHMALCRARANCGDDSLRAELENNICNALSRQRDNDKLAREIRDMRDLIAKEKGDADIADIKILRGGLIDIEFIAQFLTLAYASACPQLLVVGTADLLRKAADSGLLNPADAELLLSAHRFYTDVIQMQRVVMTGGMKVDAAPKAVRMRIAAGAGLPDDRRLDLQIRDTAVFVTNIFRKTLGG